jgi:hypothetical protein
MLICFGAIFPPLALVIGVSVVKDLRNLKLVLGRYLTLEKIKNKESKMEDSAVMDRMMKLMDRIVEEILKTAREIWSGLWYGMVIASWIWAFVLFDTLSASVGVIPGLWVLVVMSIAPWLVNIVYSSLKQQPIRKRQAKKKPLTVQSILYCPQQLADIQTQICKFQQIILGAVK